MGGEVKHPEFWPIILEPLPCFDYRCQLLLWLGQVRACYLLCFLKFIYFSSEFEEPLSLSVECLCGDY